MLLSKFSFMYNAVVEFEQSMMNTLSKIEQRNTFVSPLL